MIVIGVRMGLRADLDVEYKSWKGEGIWTVVQGQHLAEDPEVLVLFWEMFLEDRANEIVDGVHGVHYVPEHHGFSHRETGWVGGSLRKVGLRWSIFVYVIWMHLQGRFVALYNIGSGQNRVGQDSAYLLSKSIVNITMKTDEPWGILGFTTFEQLRLEMGDNVFKPAQVICHKALGLRHDESNEFAVGVLKLERFPVIGHDYPHVDRKKRKIAHPFSNKDGILT